MYQNIQFCESRKNVEILSHLVSVVTLPRTPCRVGLDRFLANAIAKPLVFLCWLFLGFCTSCFSDFCLGMSTLFVTRASFLTPLLRFFSLFVPLLRLTASSLTSPFCPAYDSMDFYHKRCPFDIPAPFDGKIYAPDGFLLQCEFYS